MLPQPIASLAAVIWVLLPAFSANALATLPRGTGPAMDLGRSWPWDHRRVLGPSKTWSGFFVGSALGIAIGLVEAGVILLAPPNLAVVPRLAPSIVAAIPVVSVIAFGAMIGDAVGSFIKRRIDRPSGSRVWLLDQFPFVLVPIALGFAFYPALFVATFANWEAIIWVVLLTLLLHVGFNWVGYKAGLKRVPW
ncbi:MAG: CDP-2,3-bis-(O-geranylgeranyl)-sn-glycerol synthase [Thermoplasmatales archaeon]|nr:CDP-2,3-bis-(O-geranylgeranyl)-sn-glycerol synthase [Thermoplasmatales archaeon]